MTTGPHTDAWPFTQRNGIEVVVSPALEAVPGLVHAFTPAGYNMSLRAGPEVETTADRRRRLCETLGLKFDHLTGAAQVHGAEVVPVTEDLIGAGRDVAHPPVAHVDGLVTDTLGAPLLGLSADCPIVLACDPQRRVLGLAHAGWRGTIAGVTNRLIAHMTRRLDCDPARLVAAIAPCAGPGAYQVRDDVVRVAAARWEHHEVFFRRQQGLISFDLRAANIAQLRAAGIPADNIHVAENCTISDTRLFSYRRDGPNTGHAALVAALI